MLPKLDNSIIVLDFDGTITKQDTNVELLNAFGNDENQWIEQQYIQGSMGTKEAMAKHFDIMKLSQDQYNDFVSSRIELDPGFTEFYQTATERNIPIVVVSGGFHNAIDLVFNKANIQIPKVYANRLVSDQGHLRTQFLQVDSSCDKSFGPCGNCKAKRITSVKEDHDTVIFVGDGLTDRCAAEEADYVYAKGDLADYCKEHNIPFQSYSSFHDVTQYLFNNR